MSAFKSFLTYQSSSYPHKKHHRKHLDKPIARRDDPNILRFGMGLWKIRKGLKDRRPAELRLKRGREAWYPAGLITPRSPVQIRAPLPRPHNCSIPIYSSPKNA